MRKLFIALTAACMVTGWSCSFDDSILNDRIDGLEGRVDNIESEINKLKQGLNQVNDLYELLSFAVGNGVITGVTETADGYKIEVTYVDQNGTKTTKTYEIKNGANGKDGVDGEDGHTPVFTLGGPDDKGYYWLVDGQEVKGADGKRVYASATDGEDGANGATPHLAVAPKGDNDTPDFSSDDTKALYWWVSYDWDGNDAAATWEELYAVASVTAEVDIEATVEDGYLVISVNGVEQARVKIESASAALAITYTVDGEEVEEFGTVTFAEDESIDIVVDVVGKKEDNFAVEARLQNAGSYEVYVDDDTISVTRTGNTATKLFVEVLNGDTVRKSWLTLAPEIEAWLEIPALSESGYLPVAAGSVTSGNPFSFSFDTATAFPNLPETVVTDLVIMLDRPAPADIEFVIENEELWDAPVPGLTLSSDTVTVKEGETTATVQISFPRSTLEGDGHHRFLLYDADDNYYAQKYFFVAKNFAAPYNKLTADAFTTIFDYYDNASVTDLSEKGYGIAGMLDGDSSTFMRSEGKNGTPLSTNDWYKIGMYYGPWMDIQLPEGVAVIGVGYQNYRDYMVTTAVYSKTIDSDLPNTGTSYSAEHIGVGEWNKFALTPVGEATKMRFGMKAAKTGSITYQLSANSAWGAIWTGAIAEFELYVMY